MKKEEQPDLINLDMYDVLYVNTVMLEKITNKKNWYVHVLDRLIETSHLLISIESSFRHLKAKYLQYGFVRISDSCYFIKPNKIKMIYVKDTLSNENIVEYTFIMESNVEFTLLLSETYFKQFKQQYFNDLFQLKNKG